MEYKYKDSQVSQNDIERDIEILRPYRDILGTIVESRTFEAPEGALASPYIKDALDAALDVQAMIGDAHRVFLVGIGGSSLGTEAVWCALGATGERTLHVYDSINPSALASLKKFLAEEKPDIADCAIIIVTKSGKTIETLFNAEALVGMLGDVYGEASVAPRTVVITDEGSALDSAAKKRGYRVEYTPRMIGGRFSVFTASSAIPLALLGIDMGAFLEGAKSYIEREVLGEASDAMSAASIMYRAIRRGDHAENTFLFDDRLFEYGRWCSQLHAESLGKKAVLQGGDTYGLIPTLSAAEDLHSIGQLYMSGALGILTQVHRVRGHSSEDVIAEDKFGMGVVAGKRASEIRLAIEEGVLETYRELALPYTEYVLDAISPRELGALMASRMLETIYAAELLGINAFDQPNVELYKSKTRRILEGR